MEKSANHGSANSLVTCPANVLSYAGRKRGYFTHTRARARVCMCACMYVCVHVCEAVLLFFYYIDFIHHVQHLGEHKRLFLLVFWQPYGVVMFFFSFIAYRNRRKAEARIVNDKLEMYQTSADLQDIFFFFYFFQMSCKGCF